MNRHTANFLRTNIKRARSAVEKLAPVSGNHSNPAFVYAGLNNSLVSMAREAGEGFRPSYGWPVLQAARLAEALGVERISVLEFGVAGGKGLVALEMAAERTEALFNVRIDVHGFDTGRGLPPPQDYRDLPNLYAESTFRMDPERLRSRLRRARLHLGLIRDTVVEFLDSKPAPVGFAAFDVDYYSSTVDAFALFRTDPARMLPRVHCYFDDIMGFTYTEWTGQRLAINEFNEQQAQRKISPIFGLKYFLPPVYASQQWSEMMYLAHVLDHPLYGRPDGLLLTAEEPLPPDISMVDAR